MRSRNRLRIARAEAMARLSALSARVLATPSDDVLAERLATARLLYDQARTPAALAEVTALVAETDPLPSPRPLARRSRRRDRRAVPSGIRAAAHARRSRPTRPGAVVPVVRPDWWRKPALAMGGAAVILFSMATSEPGADVGPYRVAVAVAAVVFGVAVGWFAMRARPVVAAYRTRRAAVAAGLNEIAARVLHPPPAESPEEAREQAAEAQRYVLLLHSYATEPLAVVERLLGKR